ncbi:MAG TPA: hypothetical protein VLL73_06220 [Desulfurivibrionaceae bacterium]|nr:hypothetical protein [Desulfurivibrionaceae bacterium]
MLIDAIREIAATQGLEITEKKGLYTMERVVAERKAFLSRKKLLYRAKFRIEEEKKELLFTELLKESGFGLSSGSTDTEMSPGFGFKKETYKTGMGPREGTIEEQSRLFGKEYTYTFDVAAVRKAVEAAAQAAGYTFHWKFFL